MKKRHETELKDAGIKVAGSAIQQIGAAIVGWIASLFRGGGSRAQRGKTLSESRKAAAEAREKEKRHG